MKRPAVLAASLRCLMLGALSLTSGAAFSTTFDLDAMARTAGERGWETARAADGSLLLYPGTPNHEAAAVAEETPVVRPNDRLASLGDRLAASGWRVSRHTDGSLLLYPGAKAPAASSGESRAAGNASPDARRADPLGRLASILDQRGWRTARDTSGNLLLYLG